MDGTVQTTEKVLKGKLVYIPVIDPTFTKEGYSADAKLTGDRLNTLADAVNELQIEGGASASAVYYDDSKSGIGQDTVQGAIDTLCDTLKNMADYFVMKNEDGIVDGAMMVQNADNGYGSLMKNNSSSADYGTQIADVSASGNTAKITVNALSNLLTFTDANSNIRAIHHEGNKQFGNYSGNGSATQRVIDMKSIGRLCIVYNPSYLSFVTPEGAFVRSLSDGSDRWIEGGKVFYINGKLTLLTTNDAFNKNGETYYYQAI